MIILIGDTRKTMDQRSKTRITLEITLENCKSQSIFEISSSCVTLLTVNKVGGNKYPFRKAISYCEWRRTTFSNLELLNLFLSLPPIHQIARTCRDFRVTPLQIANAFESHRGFNFLFRITGCFTGNVIASLFRKSKLVYASSFFIFSSFLFFSREFVALINVTNKIAPVLRTKFSKRVVRSRRSFVILLVFFSSYSYIEINE